MLIVNFYYLCDMGKSVRKLVGLCVLGMLFPMCATAQEYQLVWCDEFNTDGRLDDASWNYERGFTRNRELQWYQPDNAYCLGGHLIIEARQENRPNPMYEEGSKDWRRSREFIECTSSSVTTSKKHEFLYGRFEVRARIPVAKGAWPAIWTLGNHLPWPSCGEIDIMEFYRIDGVPHILANAAWGTERRSTAKWDTQTVPFSHFLEQNPDWASEFHVWRMDWDEEAIRLYLDDELLNETLLTETINGSPDKSNPFKQPHYILLNLAVGGNNGGPDEADAYPMRYEIDYVRVYQKK